jgi:hypothetical protein
MVRLRVAVCALSLLACGDDDDDGGDDVPMADADPLAPDGASVDADPLAPDGGGTVDADPEAFPEIVFRDPGGSIQNEWAVDPATDRAVVWTYVKFDDELVDDFDRDLGVVGGGLPSESVPYGAFPRSAAVTPGGHLLAAFANFLDPITGESTFNVTSYVYDFAAKTSIPLTGSPEVWGSNYPHLSGNGQFVYHFLDQSPDEGDYPTGYNYKQNLADLKTRPGAPQLPLDFSFNTAGVSWDGRIIVFVSYDPLVPADTDSGPDAYAWDSQEETMYLLSEGDVDPSTTPSVGARVGGGYRVAFHEPPATPSSYGDIIACQIVLGSDVGCEIAGDDVTECPGGLCVASVSISPNGRWLSFGTLKVIDETRDEGGLSDQHRLDLDIVFAGGTAPIRFMTPTPPDYPETVQIRFNALQPRMNDDGSLFFLDSYGGSGLAIWRTPAY